VKKKDFLKDSRSKSQAEVIELLRQEEMGFMKLRFKAGVGQLKNTAEIRDIKKRIARLRTILSEKFTEQSTTLKAS
jgi:large subunit ribosomal protein L29